MNHGLLRYGRFFTEKALHMCIYMYQQSAEALMLGMYPPSSGSVTEVVELHTLDTEYDYITANPRY